jgi:hypothetical protein
MSQQKKRTTKLTPPIQFNWRRNWSKKVAPYLNEEFVQGSLDMGMTQLDPNWQRGDAPCSLGAIGFNRIVKGKLSWYQPLNRCHHISFFSMAIGVLNYPDLDWRFISGDRHTVPVGYDAEGNPRVVMDILLFDFHSAEQSISLAQEDFPKLKPTAKERESWDKFFAKFIDVMVQAIRLRAKELRTGGEKEG